MPAPLTSAHAQHLADYVLERLAEGLAGNDGLTGETLATARAEDLAIALQRVIGAVAGEAAELRLIALLDQPSSGSYCFGPSALSIAEARMCFAADAAAAQATRSAA
ncbi:hypothetical protein [Pelomonas sp. Root1444]|uniref:hypothetical protein n=1 Tax=Pelomonas sp. Root1444 TaxID=1736464 RepID=UPI000703A7B0|nr:hypothetical protein [Pelomonas sp. Root1444]KQY83719.1 hypothetical protein ASD35_24160 [Pelomonas sp. Root1444]